MSGDIGDITTAVGEIGLGTAAAKAVEPSADGSSASETGDMAGDACLNCGTALVGAHCHACGQKAKIHRTLRAFLHDLLHGVLHFEGKFWRTLPLLAWRPGKLIRDYIDGKRARYVSPIALFLFTVFISFALFSMSGGFGAIEPEIDPESRAQLEINVADAEKALAISANEIEAARARGEPVAELQMELEVERRGVDMLKQLLATETSEDSPFKITTIDGEDITEELTKPSNQRGGNQAGTWLKDTWDAASANPGLLVYRLQTNAYKLSWLLIPLSLPFVWLLFPFSRRFKMYDHTVFVTYSISFMTMLAVVLSVGIAFAWWPLIVAPLLYAPFHLYRSLRGGYDLSRLGAMWRMFVLSAGVWLTMTLFVLIMVGIVIA